LLAQHPTERKLILQAWGHMFPWDAGPWKAPEHPDYYWLDAVRSDPNINNPGK
jgi:hypothetical protein